MRSEPRRRTSPPRPASRREISRLTGALAELDAGRLGRPARSTIVTGPEEYLFGEEKALLEVIEGNEPLPRWLPPYLHGLFARQQLGWDARSRRSRRRSRRRRQPDAGQQRRDARQRPAHHGSRSGVVPVDRHRARRRAPSAAPSSATSPAPAWSRWSSARRWLRCSSSAVAVPKVVRCGPCSPACQSGDHRDQLATPVSYEDFESIGSGLGSAGFIVYDDTTCMVEVAAMLSRFLSVESCGQCPPCKLGTAAITDALDQIANGTATDRQLDVISERLRVVTDGNRCYLPVEEQRLVSSLLTTFPEDFADHLEPAAVHDHDDCRSPRSSTSPTAPSPTTPARPASGETGPTPTAESPQCDERSAHSVRASLIASDPRPAAPFSRLGSDREGCPATPVRDVLQEDKADFRPTRRHFFIVGQPGRAARHDVASRRRASYAARKSRSA